MSLIIVLNTVRLFIIQYTQHTGLWIALAFSKAGDKPKDINVSAIVIFIDNSASNIVPPK